MTEDNVMYGMIKVDYNRALILPFDQAIELYRLILKATPVNIGGYTNNAVTRVLEEDSEYNFIAMTEKKYKEQVFALILENQAE